MEWIKSGKHPSGITIWEPNPTPEQYSDLTVHVFDERDGYTVSFGRHQVSRFKAVEDAFKFTDDLLVGRKAHEEQLAKKAESKSKRSKKNVKHVDNV